jgi:ribosomal-protein-serine acetyltransferase
MFRRTVDTGIELGLLERRHAAELLAVVDRNREHLRPWLFWAETMTSSEATLAFLDEALAQFASAAGAHLGIWVDGSLAGGIGCRPIDWRNRATSVGYWIDAGAEGRGVITKCCRVFLDYLFSDLKVNRVEIRCATGNLRSAAVPERLGFTREGISRQAEYCNGRYTDLIVFSMLASDWGAE